MSPEGRDAVAGLLALVVLIIVYVLWPGFRTWRANRRLVREFRYRLHGFDSRHVDVWRRQSGGREPPR